MASDIVRSSYVKIPSPRIDTGTACNRNVIPLFRILDHPSKSSLLSRFFLSVHLSILSSKKSEKTNHSFMLSCSKRPVRSFEGLKHVATSTAQHPGCSIREGSRRIKRLKVKMFRFLFRTRVCASKPNLFFFFSLFIFPHRYGKIHRFIFRSFFFRNSKAILIPCFFFALNF